MTSFSYPIGILLFNRPEYAAQVLESLRQQTLSVIPQSVVIVIDGFSGSKAEARGLPDQTAAVFAAASTAFPEAHIRRLPHNVGIAQAFELLEREVFALADGPDAPALPPIREPDSTLVPGALESDWALFLEEDFVLYPLYLHAIERLIAHVDAHEEIVIVNATGHTRSDVTAFPNELHPIGHFWAFALRRSHAQARKPVLNLYSEAIRTKPYWRRDRLQISQPFSALGMFVPGSSQDAIKKAIMHHLGKIGVTTGTAYGCYVGERGENFGPAVFRQQGFAVIPPVPKRFALPAPLTPERLRALRERVDQTKAMPLANHRRQPLIVLRTAVARVMQGQARSIRKNVGLIATTLSEADR